MLQAPLRDASVVLFAHGLHDGDASMPAPAALSAAAAPAGAVLETQGDITYVAAPSRSVLNGPGTTGMGYWSVNPYVGCALGCTYCYARYAHRYASERAESAGESHATMPAWLAFERRIRVKTNAGEVLGRALRNAARRPTAGKRAALLLGREAVVIGTATDPYQPAERRFRVTRRVLEALAEHRGLRVAIITKSPLVTRDVDVLARIATRSSLVVHISLVTLDRELARRIEPRAPTPEARLRAIRRLREAGIVVGVNVMPVLPGLTDRPADLEALVAAVADAGASFAGACALRLRSDARDRYLPFIESEFPALAERYRTAYGASHQVGACYREGLQRVFTRLCRRHGVSIWGAGLLDDDEDDAMQRDGHGGAKAERGSVRLSSGSSRLRVVTDSSGSDGATQQLALSLN